MRQISVKKFLAGRPACSIPLGLEFKRWFDAPLTARQNDIISLLEYHRQEKKRAPYLIIHDPHNRSDVREILEAYLQWRNEMTAPALRAALVTPKRFETNCRSNPSENKRRRREVVGNPMRSHRRSVGPLSPASPACGRKGASAAMPKPRKPIQNSKFQNSKLISCFTARNYKAAHGQTFAMVAALNCQQFMPKRKPEDGFADFPSIFITMLDRTSPHHLLILHGCIPQGSNHSFGRFMTRAAAQNAPYLIYDTLSRSFLTPEQMPNRSVGTRLIASTPPNPLRKKNNPQIFVSPDAINRVPTSSPARAKLCNPQSPLAGTPPPRIKRECRPRRQKRNCPARGRGSALIR